ncbi:hypothetical protein OH708_08200 [Pseudomonas capsici]|uniref:hypothetical protein n=1 Tax=Pseudomonas capsici TaxID=2810614 RepID=UPI0021F0CBAF|nr:hypothetical protein [Pseudomonas capsici]MCV4287883.1 hypothetical protein [Pseudomonas capsici]
MSIWTRIKLWAERKERDAWLEKYHCDQRCHKCNTWQGNCGGWRHVEHNVPDAIHDTCTCGKCGQVTVFFDFGMGFMPVDPITLEPLQ